MPPEGCYLIVVDGAYGPPVRADGSPLAETPDDWPGLPELIEVDRDTTREVRILVTSPPGVKMPESTPVKFRLTESVMGEVVTADDYFKAP